MSHASFWNTIGRFILYSIPIIIAWFGPPYLLVCLLGRKFLRLSSGPWSLSNRGMFLFYLLAAVWFGGLVWLISNGVINW